MSAATDETVRRVDRAHAGISARATRGGTPCWGATGSPTCSIILNPRRSSKQLDGTGFGCLHHHPTSSPSNDGTGSRCLVRTPCRPYCTCLERHGVTVPTAPAKLGPGWGARKGSVAPGPSHPPCERQSAFRGVSGSPTARDGQPHPAGRITSGLAVASRPCPRAPHCRT